ncbi:Methionine aminopeptidase 1D, chloroplastic/mitochondrial [Apostasia shenzhenica]|uniref:Methionine aminopeptidase n=1 Tax=Apostasia shenzhenica TaxID=1088818 RepID=A0A2I0AIU4_9ASPA|nr:Methionine aminopeptidase 1D, chloroplastic/mitochondrial [Apostasia shenzhenica]
MSPTLPVQHRLFRSFFGDRLPHSSRPLSQLLGLDSGKRHALVLSTRTYCNLADLLFSGRNSEWLRNQRKPLKPGKVSPRLHVPVHIPKPPYVKSSQAPGICHLPEIHDERGIECMRASGRLAAQVLEYAGTLVKPGLTTDDIDKAVHQMIIDNGAYPSPLGYGGFPKSVCTSVNECICHGIPDSRELEDGDIINIDVTVYLNGYHGDTSATFLCGNVDDAAKQLVQVTRECLYKAISICAPGVAYHKIGQAIKFSFANYNFILFAANNENGHMLLGQTFTIEPMLTMGSIKPVIWSDGWTAVTKDGSLSAQFEHTILIAEHGAEILTQC